MYFNSHASVPWYRLPHEILSQTSPTHRRIIYLFNFSMIGLALSLPTSQAGTEFFKSCIGIFAIVLGFFDKSFLQSYRMLRIPMILLSLFVAWMTLSCLIHPHFEKSLRPLFSYLSQMLLVPVIVGFGHRIAWNRVFLLFLIGAGLQGYLVAAQYSFGIQGWVSSLLNIGPFPAGLRSAGTLTSFVSAMAIGIGALFLWIAGKQLQQRNPNGFTPIGEGFLWIGIVFLIVFPQIRGAWIAVIVGAFIFVSLLVWQTRTIPSFYLIFLFLILLLLIIQINPMIYERIDETLVENPLNAMITDSVSFRFDLFHHSLSIIQESPIFGIGLANFNASVVPFFESNPMNHLSKIWHAHNDILTIASTSGIPATILILLCIGLLYYRGIRWVLTHYRQKVSILMISFMLTNGTLLVYGASEFVMFGGISGNIFWFSMSLLMYLSLQTQESCHFACLPFPFLEAISSNVADSKPRRSMVVGSWLKYIVLVGAVGVLAWTLSNPFYSPSMIPMSVAPGSAQLFIKESFFEKDTLHLLIQSRLPMSGTVVLEALDSNQAVCQRYQTMVNLKQGEAYLWSLEHFPVRDATLNRIHISQKQHHDQEIILKPF